MLSVKKGNLRRNIEQKEPEGNCRTNTKSKLKIHGIGLTGKER